MCCKDLLIYDPSHRKLVKDAVESFKNVLSIVAVLGVTFLFEGEQLLNLSKLVVPSKHEPLILEKFLVKLQIEHKDIDLPWLERVPSLQIGNRPLRG